MTSNFEVIQDGGVPIKMWIKNLQIEEGAKKQIINISKLPFIYKHIAVMPDVHSGIGSVIGSVIPTIGAIVPAFVGVDISCGMAALKTDIKLSDIKSYIPNIYKLLSEAIPNGRTDNGGKYDVGSWKEDKIPDLVEMSWLGLEGGYKNICNRNPKVKHEKVITHIGTLGTGNHFIELSTDEEDNVWVMLHSGSRGPGAKIANHFIDLAKRDMDKYFIILQDRNLAYFPQGTQNFDDYLEAVTWAQKYAEENRATMLALIIRALKKRVGNFDISEQINCHHNYVSTENHFGKNVFVTRKGAICAREGMMGIIPGSMGTKSYIVRGLGNKDSFTSASHGAGRLMSRTKAKETFTLKDHRAATEGVECAKDKSVIDETPGAYKDIDAVIEAEKDLVEVVYTLKQFICVKGTGEGD